MAVKRAPRDTGFPSYREFDRAFRQSNPRTIYRMLEILWHRTGGGSDQVFEEHVSGQVTDGQLQEIRQDISTVEEVSRAFSESLSQIEEVKSIQEELAARISDVDALDVATFQTFSDRITQALSRIEGTLTQVDVSFSDELSDLRDQLDEIIARQASLEGQSTPEAILNAGNGLTPDSFAGTGLMTKLTNSFVTTRTLTAGSDIAITNGNGVSGDPTIAVDVNFVESEPVLRFGGATTGITQNTAASFLRYWLHEGSNLVYVSCNIQLTSKGTATGGATVDLPLPALQASDALPCSFFVNMTGLNSVPYARTNTNLELRHLNGAGTGHLQLTDTEFTNTSIFRFSGWYLRDAP